MICKIYSRLKWRNSKQEKFSNYLISREGYVNFKFYTCLTLFDMGGGGRGGGEESKKFFITVLKDFGVGGLNCGLLILIYRAILES